MRIQANGIGMNVESTGQGPCLVLIHGYSDNLTMWFNQTPAFSKDYRVAAYDVRGFGQSEISRGNYSMDLFSRDLHALLKALDIDKACVLGYSMGGRIGLQFVMDHPEMAAGLIFANSGVVTAEMQPSPEQLAEMAEMRQQMMTMLESGDIEIIADAMTEHSLSPGTRERNPQMFERYKGIKLQNDPAAYVDIMQAIAASYATPPDLSQVACPALVIAGEHDSFMAVEVAEAMVKALPEAESVLLPTGHAAAIEAPERFNAAVLAFLKNLDW